MINESLSEHQALKQVLVRLDGADATSPDVGPDINEAKRLVTHHVQEEEQDPTPSPRCSTAHVTSGGG